MLVGDADKENTIGGPACPTSRPRFSSVPLPPGVFRSETGRPFPKTLMCLPRAGAARRQVRPHPRVHAPGRQEGHGPARRGSESRPGPARSRRAPHHQVYALRAAVARGLARLGHAQREHEALSFSWFIRPVRDPGEPRAARPRRLDRWRLRDDQRRVHASAVASMAAVDALVRAAARSPGDSIDMRATPPTWPSL